MPIRKIVSRNRIIAPERDLICSTPLSAPDSLLRDVAGVSINLLLMELQIIIASCENGGSVQRLSHPHKPEPSSLRLHIMDKVIYCKRDCKSCSISLLTTLNSDLPMPSSLVCRFSCLLFSTLTLVISSSTRQSLSCVHVSFGFQLFRPRCCTLPSFDDASLLLNDIVAT